MRNHVGSSAIGVVPFREGELYSLLINKALKDAPFDPARVAALRCIMAAYVPSADDFNDSSGSPHCHLDVRDVESLLRQSTPASPWFVGCRLFEALGPAKYKFWGIDALRMQASSMRLAAADACGGQSIAKSHIAGMATVGACSLLALEQTGREHVAMWDAKCPFGRKQPLKNVSPCR